MTQMFGENACFETPESFFEDFFVYCLPLSRNPSVQDNHGFAKNPVDKQLSFGEGAALDVTITFRTAVKEEILLHCVGIFDVFVALSDQGEILQN